MCVSLRAPAIYVLCMLAFLACKTKDNESTLSDDGSGSTGHDDYDPEKDPYKILTYNCHSAANLTVRKSSHNTGIIICANYSDQGDPSGHTFNYRFEKDKFVFFNWGQTCEAPLTGSSLDVHDDAIMSCLYEFCGNQFSPGGQDGGTRSLPPGQQVEEPGPLYCSEKATSISLRSDCDSCCRYRGTMWDRMPGNLRPTDNEFVNYMSQCFTGCAAKFK
jgi:hypothetical protein